MPGSSDAAAKTWPLATGAVCYILWGFFPYLFQPLGHRGVGAWEILAQRIIWGTPTALLFVLAAGQRRQLTDLLAQPRTAVWLLLSAILISVNWASFIIGVNSGRVLETSLGYYIVPLINMACGALIFRERIHRVDAMAMALAAAGVVVQAATVGGVPMISLIIAISFGAYGIVRKQVAVDAQTGLFVECFLLSIPGLLYVLWLHRHGAGHFGASAATGAWLIFAGIMTVIPLALFAWTVRRIPLAQVGFLQFLAPTITFVIGLSQHEPFSRLRAVSFALIWASLIVYTLGAWRRWRQPASPQSA